MTTSAGIVLRAPHTGLFRNISASASASAFNERLTSRINSRQRASVRKQCEVLATRRPRRALTRAVSALGRCSAMLPSAVSVATEITTAAAAAAAAAVDKESATHGYSHGPSGCSGRRPPTIQIHPDDKPVGTQRSGHRRAVRPHEVEERWVSPHSLADPVASPLRRLRQHRNRRGAHGLSWSTAVDGGVAVGSPACAFAIARRQRHVCISARLAAAAAAAPLAAIAGGAPATTRHAVRARSAH